MRVLVCGGREYADAVKVYTTLDEIHASSRGGITLVIHGACCEPSDPTKLRGADRWAQEWAQSRQVAYLGHPAPWNTYGKRAGPLRNGYMIDHGPHLVVVFPGGRGTADMMKQAEAANVPIRLIDLTRPLLAQISSGR